MKLVVLSFAWQSFDGLCTDSSLYPLITSFAFEKLFNRTPLYINNLALSLNV